MHEIEIQSVNLFVGTPSLSSIILKTIYCRKAKFAINFTQFQDFGIAMQLFKKIAHF